jgi:hypothetical protein
MEDNLKSRKKLLVIGGGAAGFFCAVNAARLNPGLKVTLAEKSNKLLSKVRISGGGRCNVTHACFEIGEMIRRYPRGSSFLKKAFHQFFTSDTIDWFRERGVELKTESDGRMFPISDSSQTIIDCLLREANKFKVEILMNREVAAVKKNDRGFEVCFSNGENFLADEVCIACGGYPKAAQFTWLKQLGHSIEDPVPSLFTFNMPGNAITSLMGVVASHARVKIPGTKLQEQGPLLITHWGMSGPAILKLSAWGARELAARGWKFSVVINWLADNTEQQLRDQFAQMRFAFGSQKLSAKSSFGLPSRLWLFLLGISGIDVDTRWADLSSKAQNKLISNLCAYECAVNGKTTFKEEFVTAGGIKLQEVDANTMMSKKIPGLYFAGEILDIDGITGGFNFQNAWTTGFIAAKTIAGNK